jgi:HEAT repeat protein
MIRTLKHDEVDSVRQSTINFFTTSEDEKCLLNQLPPEEKQQMLPALIRDLQNPGNWGLRNNAANALKWFPEQREIVAPVLVKALQDSQRQVRLLAAEALGHVDPDAAKRAGALSVVVAVAKDPDDQIASRAVAALRHFQGEPELAVRALIEGLDSTNSLVACQSVWSLEWSPKEYKSYAAAVIPALQKAAQRKDNVGGYAKAALKRWESETVPAQGGK